MKRKIISLALAAGMAFGIYSGVSAMTYGVGVAVKDGETVTLPEPNIMKTDGFSGDFEGDTYGMWVKEPNTMISTEQALIGTHSLKTDLSMTPCDNVDSGLSSLAGISVKLDYPDEFSTYPDYDAYKLTVYAKVEGKLVDSSVWAAPISSDNVLGGDLFRINKNTKDINTGKWVRIDTYITKKDFKAEKAAAFTYQLFSTKGNENSKVCVYLDAFSIVPFHSKDIPVTVVKPIKGKTPTIKPKTIKVKTKTISGVTTKSATVKLTYSTKKSTKTIKQVKSNAKGAYKFTKLNLKKYKNKTLKITVTRKGYTTVSKSFKVKK